MTRVAGDACIQGCLALCYMNRVAAVQLHCSTCTHPQSIQRAAALRLCVQACHTAAGSKNMPQSSRLTTGHGLQVGCKWSMQQTQMTLHTWQLILVSGADAGMGWSLVSTSPAVLGIQVQVMQHAVLDLHTICLAMHSCFGPGNVCWAGHCARCLGCTGCSDISNCWHQGVCAW
jgi:hypothetical protein